MINSRFYGILNRMHNKRILVAVGHALQEPWITIFNTGSEKTWLQTELPSNIEMIHFHGSPLNKAGLLWDKLHEYFRWKNRWFATVLAWLDTIIGFPSKFFIPKVQVSKKIKTSFPVLGVNFPDSYQFLRWKSLAILKYFVENTSCDYMFMTTNNSYINFKNLSLVVENLPKDSFYGGAKAYDGAEFAAGNNRIISRDVAEKFIRNRKNFSLSKIEDAAMGELAHFINIRYSQLPSLVIESLSNLDKTADSEIVRHFHIRVKSGTLKSRNDVTIMTRLHERLTNLGAL